MKKVILFVLLLNPTPFLLGQEMLKKHKMSIIQLFELAESNSRKILISDLLTKELEQAIKLSKNGLLPSLDVSASASYLGNGRIIDRDFSHGSKAPTPHFGNNFAIEASQVIYAGGAIRNGIKLAEVQHEISKQESIDTRQNIRFLLVANYLELYKLGNQEKVYMKNIEQTEKLVSEIRYKQEQGLALKNDITRYELELKSLELGLTQVRNDLIIINHRLVTILNMPEDVIIEIDTQLLEQIPTLSNEVQWQEMALLESPSLQKAKWQIKQADYNEKVAKSERLPSIALIAGNRLDGPITFEIPPINKNFNYWYVGVGVKFNIASLYKSNKKIRLAQMAQSRAFEEKNLQEENVQIEVKEAHVRFIEAFTIYETQQKSVELATQNYDVVNNRYLNDLALLTDMLDASNSKLSAELQLANAQVNILFNYYKLKKSAGNL